MFVFRALLLFGICGAQARTFPEEKFREIWDRGCADWSARLSPSLRQEANPSFAFEKGDGVFRFFLKQRLDLERGEPARQAAQVLERILLEGPRYPEWVLPGVNESPDGGSYFVELQDLKVERHGPWGHLLKGPFRFNLLLLSVEGHSTIEMKTERRPLPDCEAFVGGNSGETLKLSLRMYPRPGLLDWLVGEIWVLHRPEGSELRGRLVLKPAERIFALMPEALLKNQLQDRARRLLENLLDFKRREALKKASKAALPALLPLAETLKKAL